MQADSIGSTVDFAQQQRIKEVDQDISRREQLGQQEMSLAKEEGDKQIDLATRFADSQQPFTAQQPQEHMEQIMAGAPWLFALAALGGVASKGNGMMMLEGLNGVSDGLLKGDQEAMQRSWDRYNDAYQKWKDRSDQQFKIYQTLAQAYGNAGDAKIRAMMAAHQMTNDAYAARMQADDPMTLLKMRSELELNHARATEAYAKAHESVGANAPIPKDAIDFYARQQMAGDTQWRTGLSRTKEGVAIIRAVDMRIPELAKMYGISPEQASTTRDFRKALDKSLEDRTRNVAAAEQFVGNFRKQTELVEKYLGPGVGGATPVFNRWIQAGRKQVTGDDEVNALDTALRGLAREHQRIVTGVTSNAQLHVASAQTGDELINKDMTAHAIRKTMKVMLEEADNAVASGKDEMGQIRSQLSQLGVAGIESRGHKVDAEDGGVMQQKPDPAQYKGQRLRDTETGEVFVSDGKQWVPQSQGSGATGAF